MTTFIFLSTLTLTGNQVLLGLLGVAATLGAVIVGVKWYWKQHHAAYRKEAQGLSSLTKKYNAVDVYQYSANIKLLSLVTAIGVVLMIFAWTHYSHNAYLEGNGLVVEGLVEDMPVTTHEPPQKLPALPPPPIENGLIEEVDNEPIIEPEPPVEPWHNVPTTGPYDGAAAPTFGNIEIEPEPAPAEPEIISIEKTLTVAEQMPRFPGCEEIEGEHAVKKQCADQKMVTFIYDNIRYPRQASEIGVEGIAVVSFVVDKQGKIQNVKLLRDPGAGLGKEALRIVRMMNTLPQAWTPGKQRGRKVKVQYSLPIRFKLTD
ncbi:MAG: energy transducer TonB [Aureispira sp.]